MFIVEVIPLSKTNTPALSYFSHTSFPRGARVDAPIRGKIIPAIVVRTTGAVSMKAALRAATFSLRKLPEQSVRRVISEELFKTAEIASQQFGTSISTLLYSILPKEIKEGTVEFPLDRVFKECIPVFENKPIVLISPTSDREQEYERMVRESFAGRHSIMFVVPTQEHAEQLQKKLQKGIERYTLTFHGGLSSSTLKKNYTVLNESEHPLLLITTPSYSLLERGDVCTILLEHERSHAYRGRTRPYVDFRFILMTYARLRDITLILADSVIRTEEMHMLESGEAVPFDLIPKRLQIRGMLLVIQTKVEGEENTEFKLFTPALKNAIDEAIEQKKRVFLFCSRRGLAPLVACIDCGHILRDCVSGSPLALIRTMKNGVEERWLTSSVSGFKERARDLCPQCGSWRLRERGIGIQNVYDELIKSYKKEDVMMFDHLSAKTRKQAHAIRDAFYSKGGTILLGTAMALPFLHKSVDMSAIISMDSLRAIPSWRQQEEMFALLISLREKTAGTVHVQTRVKDDEILSLARDGTLETFYREELKARKDFKYPPYYVFVHFSWKEPPSPDSPTKKLLGTLFAPYDISLYSAYENESGTSILNYGLLRIAKDEWPHPEIIKLLGSLSPAIRIMINPDKIV